MIELIHTLLNSDVYHYTDRIDTAKGKYELSVNLKEAWKKYKTWQLKR